MKEIRNLSYHVCGELWEIGVHCVVPHGVSSQLTVLLRKSCIKAVRSRPCRKSRFLETYQYTRELYFNDLKQVRLEPNDSGQVREDNHNKTLNAVRTLNSETRYVTTLLKYWVIHKFLRDFRPLRYSGRDGHATHVQRTCVSGTWLQDWHLPRHQGWTYRAPVR